MLFFFYIDVKLISMSWEYNMRWIIYEKIKFHFLPVLIMPTQSQEEGLGAIKLMYVLLNVIIANNLQFQENCLSTVGYAS